MMNRTFGSRNASQNVSGQPGCYVAPVQKFHDFRLELLMNHAPQSSNLSDIVAAPRVSLGSPPVLLYLRIIRGAVTCLVATLRECAIGQSKGHSRFGNLTVYDRMTVARGSVLVRCELGAQSSLQQWELT
jgi:hypothetical protein